jgi:hypothetical protein
MGPVSPAQRWVCNCGKVLKIVSNLVSRKAPQWLFDDPHAQSLRVTAGSSPYSLKQEYYQLKGYPTECSEFA